MKERSSYMNRALRDTAAPYNENVRGVTAEEERWLTCSDTANSFFPMPVGALFVDTAFPEENKLVVNLKNRNELIVIAHFHQMIMLGTF